MDTGDLSEEAYTSILIKAESFHHDLTLKFGLLSYKCKDENDYLKNSLLLIDDWESDIESAVCEIFFENNPDINKFRSVLKELRESIKEVQKLPFENRTFE